MVCFTALFDNVLQALALATPVAPAANRTDAFLDVHQGRVGVSHGHCCAVKWGKHVRPHARA